MTNGVQISFKHFKAENHSLLSHPWRLYANESIPDRCLPDGADYLFSDIQSSFVTSDPCSLHFSPDINVQTCPPSIQVNGLNVQGATHQEAVSALRNAGSCIKMTVVRDRTSDPGGLQDQRDVVERQLCRPTAESAEEPPSRKTEANFCNGNGVVGSSTESPSREEVLNPLTVFVQVGIQIILLLFFSLYTAVGFGE